MSSFTYTPIEQQSTYFKSTETKNVKETTT